MSYTPEDTRDLLIHSYPGKDESRSATVFRFMSLDPKIVSLEVHFDNRGYGIVGFEPVLEDGKRGGLQGKTPFDKSLGNLQKRIDLTGLKTIQIYKSHYKIK